MVKMYLIERIGLTVFGEESVEDSMLFLFLYRDIGLYICDVNKRFDTNISIINTFKTQTTCVTLI